MISTTNEVPIDMVLFCPRCGTQHIDAPEPAEIFNTGNGSQYEMNPDRWTNPPHRSHQCGACKTVWRPADVPTNGIERVLTKGSADTWEPRLGSIPSSQPARTLAADASTPTAVSLPVTAAQYLCKPKCGGDGFVIKRAPDSFELRECRITPLYADRESFLALIENAIHTAGRGSDTYTAAMIAADHIRGLRAAPPTIAATPQAPDPRTCLHRHQSKDATATTRTCHDCGTFFDDATNAQTPVTPGSNLEGLREQILAPRGIVRTAEGWPTHTGARDPDGWLSHPAIPVCDEGTHVGKLLEAFGIETSFVSMKSDAADFHDRWCEEGLSDCSGWVPTPPGGDGWLLLEIYDTEDGPYALFGRNWYEAKKIRKQAELAERRNINRIHAASAPREKIL